MEIVEGFFTKDDRINKNKYNRCIPVFVFVVFWVRIGPAIRITKAFPTMLSNAFGPVYVPPKKLFLMT